MNQEQEALIEDIIAVQTLMVSKSVELETLEQKRNDLKRRLTALEANEKLYER